MFINTIKHMLNVLPLPFKISLLPLYKCNLYNNISYGIDVAQK